jgi:hypothetical protein
MNAGDRPPFIPIVATLIAGICWAIFVLLYVVFWSQSFDLFQNIVIVFLSVAIAGCVMGLMWMSWLFRRG